MYKTLTTFILVTCLGLSGCATTMLSNTLPSETTEVKTNILKLIRLLHSGKPLKMTKNKVLSLLVKTIIT